MIDVIIDTFSDVVKLLPFLLITYIIMEYIEHKMGEKAKQTIERSGRFGPVLGGILGAFPQCGFSAAASSLYAGGVITMGTLLAVFLATSDEMLPILISERVDAAAILQLLGWKVLAGVLAGLFVDLVVRKEHKEEHRCGGEHDGHMEIGHMCEHEHCHCEDGIMGSALRHTASIFFFLLLITFALNIIIYFAGEDFLSGLVLGRPLFGHMIAGLVGLIPNCASSVIITQLYLGDVIGFGTMMSGLLAGTGVGLLVLFRVNDDRKENMKVVLLLYTIGVLIGICLDALGITVQI